MFSWFFSQLVVIPYFRVNSRKLSVWYPQRQLLHATKCDSNAIVYVCLYMSFACVCGASSDPVKWNTLNKNNNWDNRERPASGFEAQKTLHQPPTKSQQTIGIYRVKKNDTTGRHKVHVWCKVIKWGCVFFFYFKSSMRDEGENGNIGASGCKTSIRKPTLLLLRA